MELDRRLSARVSCDLPSSFKNLSNPKDTSARFTMVKNISTGGVRLDVPGPIPITGKLKLTLTLPCATVPKYRTFEVQLSIVWVSNAPGPNMFHIGGQFMDLSEETRTAVENFNREKTSN
jgi:c-di-GMP-binding flagellar brake protein YcgR